MTRYPAELPVFETAAGTVLECVELEPMTFRYVVSGKLLVGRVYVEEWGMRPLTALARQMLAIVQARR